MTKSVLKNSTPPAQVTGMLHPARRYLAIWFPFLAADRIAITTRSCAQDEPLVFVANERGNMRITATNAVALKNGLKIGMALSDAYFVVSHFVTKKSDPDADRRHLMTCANLCEIFTPLIAIDASDGLILDITGCCHLFNGEAVLRARLEKRFCRAGMTVRTAIASTPQAAHAFARFSQYGCVAPGQEAAAAAELTVAALEATSATTLALTRAGLKTLGDLAARPSSALTARFGVGLTTHLQRILGREDVRIAPLRILPDVMSDQHFAEPILDIVELISAFTHLAQTVCHALEDRGEGARRFEVSMFRTDNQVRRIAIETAKACRSVDVLLRLFKIKCGTIADPLDPGFGFDALRLGAIQTEALDDGQMDFSDQGRSDADAGALTSRLIARLGAAHVLKPASRNTHDPARASGWIPAIRQTAPSPLFSFEATDRQGGDPPLRPLTLFAPPHLIEVMAEVPDGPPQHFRWRKKLHKIIQAEGPERIAPEWWSSRCDSATRDYYRVEDAEGGRFWVFREGHYVDKARTDWYLHGLFA